MDTFQPVTHSKIKPILLHKSLHLNHQDRDHLPRSLAFSSKAKYNLSKSPFHLQRKLPNLFKPQSQLKRVEYARMHPHCRPISTITFSSRGIEKTSLPPFHLEFQRLDGQDINSSGLKTLMKKSLTHIKIHLSISKLAEQEWLVDMFESMRKTKTLKSLTLSFHNCFHSEKSEYDIISLLTKIPQLRALKLIFDHPREFDQKSITSMSFLLPKLCLLTKISLHFSGLGSFSSSTFQDLFLGFQKIKALSDITVNLKDCTIWGDVSTNQVLSESLACLKPSRIKKLRLTVLSMCFADKFLSKFSETLARFSSLTDLSLNFFGFDLLESEGIKNLGLTLNNLPSLSSLLIYLPIKSHSQESLKNLAEILRSLHNLTRLELHFTGEISKQKNSHLQDLFSTLYVLKSLQSLTLDFSNERTILNRNLQTLGQTLKELVLLKNLELDFASADQITNQGIETIASAIQSLENLAGLRLKFGMNKEIDDKAVEKLGQALQQMKKLYFVEIGFAICIKIKSFSSLLKSLKQMKSLGEVTLNFPKSENLKLEMVELMKAKIVNNMN